MYNYYLDFVPQDRIVKRIAYAPSFGTSEWEYTLEQEKKCRELVKLFDKVSVREDDGVRLCKEHLGVDALHVVDPTMLLHRDVYFKFVKKGDGEKYIGCNYLDFSDDKLVMVKRLSCTLNLPVRQLISMGNISESKCTNFIAPSIEEWLSGIANSEYMIVDSFHATVFCILFHKNFITVANVARGLSRFSSLLKMVGLEDRLITESCTDFLDIIKHPIDWSIIDKKVLNMKEKSICFIKENL